MYCGCVGQILGLQLTAYVVQEWYNKANKSSYSQIPGQVLDF